jgi:hypothetical protein
MYHLKDIIESAASTKEEINGKWVPARPINPTCRSFCEKLREAWAVLIGKMDAVKWPEGQ